MFSKIDIPASAIRFLTLTCYFLPFVFYFSTCVDGIGKSAYNKADAIANEKEKILVEKKDVIKAAANAVVDNVSVTDSSFVLTSETLEMLENSGDDWYLTPTFTSLSAMGVVFAFENSFGPIIVVISFFLSLITFLLWRFFSRKGIGIYIISANVLTMLAFAIMCWLSNITLLYGAYMVLFLLLVQLLTEIQKRKKINSNFEVINPN